MDDGEQTRIAMATLFATLVKALGEKDRGVVTAFERHLGEAADALRDSGTDCTAALDTLGQTRRLLEQAGLETDAPAWIVYAKQTDPDLVESLQHDNRVPVPTLSEALTLWEKLPPHDRDGSVIETVGGLRLDPEGVEKVLAKQRSSQAD